jgi:hypothetical protein
MLFQSFSRAVNLHKQPEGWFKMYVGLESVIQGMFGHDTMTVVLGRVSASDVTTHVELRPRTYSTLLSIMVANIIRRENKTACHGIWEELVKVTVNV